MIQSPLDVAPEAAALAQLLAVHEQYVRGSRRPPGIGERVNTRAVQALLHARAAELTYHERTVEYISRVLEGLPKRPHKEDVDDAEEEEDDDDEEDL